MVSHIVLGIERNNTFFTFPYISANLRYHTIFAYLNFLEPSCFMVPRIHLGEKNQENLGGSPCRIKCFFEGIQDLAPGLLHSYPFMVRTRP